MTVDLLWLWAFLAVVIMFVSAFVPDVGGRKIRATLFHVAWGFALLAFFWSVLTK